MGKWEPTENPRIVTVEVESQRMNEIEEEIAEIVLELFLLRSKLKSSSSTLPNSKKEAA